ncbi:MAG: asparagine synthase (glutamine-hydrolyzing) [Rhodocyclaceae bacterium]
MCGICGALSFSGPDFLRPVKDLVPLMIRRGPDDEGHWSDAAHCALGFRRLAIQDLSPAGHQPMLTLDGRHAIVFNGEVYNFRELRRELEQAGFAFRSSGDTEVVLNALAHWGKAAIERFDGMFALAFYDTAKRSLLLARDHAGIKPLYFLKTAAGLLFASQYDQILAHPASRALPVAEEALGLYLRLGYVPAPFALLRDTWMLEPGTWVEVGTEGQMTQGRHFSFDGDAEPDLHGMAAFEAVDAAVSAAVKRQLVADVPVGVFLSGGIDSPLVAAKIRAAGNTGVKAFTIGTAGHATDESADAARYAQEIGIEHVVEHITPEAGLAMLDEVVEACGEPFGDFSIFPTMMVSRLARREVTVMLSGDGGDELFWGYAKRSGEIVSQSEKYGRPRLLRDAMGIGRRLLGLGSGDDKLRFATIGDWQRAKHSHLSTETLARIFPHVPRWPDGFELYGYEGHGRDATARWLRRNEFAGRMTAILLKVDRASMRESLEVRVPLLDREVVEVAARIDWRSCLDLERGIGKLPLRYCLGRHVKHQTQAKRGFTVPMASWLRGPLRPVFEQRVLERSALAGVQIDRRALASEYRAFVDDHVGSAWGFWLLLSLALWEDRFLARFRAPSRG